MQVVSFHTFAKALTALERAQELYEKYGEGELAVTVRNSVILEFEICYGQIRPALVRCFVEYTDLDPTLVDDMNFATIIRTANEHGYSTVEWERWRAFRDARNRTAHAYNEEQAVKIAEGLGEFIEAARELLTEMQRKQALQ